MALAASAVILPSHGVGAGGVDPGVELTVVKEVVGTPPPGATYVFDIDPPCSLTPDPAPFTGPGTQLFLVTFVGTECTLTETESSGATVTYSCTAAAGSCVDENTISVDGQIFPTITITNTFTAPSDPTTTAPAAVTADPRLTG